MVFLSICTALYDYTPQAEGELELTEGELVYVLEKDTEDDWWKAKKKAPSEDEEEPVGLIPNNYVEEARPHQQAKALYDYSRQTDEELSFSEDATLTVYDQSDPDWTLVGLNGEYGFAPSNYIELTGEAEVALPTPVASPPLPTRPVRPESPQEPSPAASPVATPAANLASILSSQTTGAPPAPKAPTPLTPDTSDEEPPPPSLPQRPASHQSASPQRLPSPQVAAPREPEPRRHEPRARQPSPPSPEPAGVISSPPLNRAMRESADSPSMPSPGGFHLYNINEMVSVMGKQKKMPTTLGINLATGMIMIIPEKKRDGPQQDWTADRLTHYSIEGKHVFMELVKPSRSIDFHAGAKDTAEEIVSSLGELAGMYRAEGLREVFAATSQGKSQKKGHMLYEFMAQGDDEVTVAENDDVVILDDAQSEEWWKVRRVKNGKEGVVPSSYVEVTGIVSPPPTSQSTSGINAGRSTVEQNRLEEERLAREAMKAPSPREDKESRGSEVGPGLRLPSRGSSLMARSDDNVRSPQKSRRDSRDKSGSAKSKPNPTKVRTWTDRTGSFKVEAQYIGLTDGKIHLHKLNGVKIAVPVSKMAAEDLEYVEQEEGVSLDEDKPLSAIRAKSQRKTNGVRKQESKAGASVEPRKPEYDWFDFFLQCGVSPYQCERYSHAFSRDSMDEGVLPDINASVLRTLGLKEGDILRVMKFLDNKYGRTGAKSKLRNVSFGGEEVIGKEDGEDGNASPPGSGSLFSGPGGTLKNNTRKGRPAPAVQTNDIVDSKVFQQKNEKTESNTSIDSPQPPEPPSKDVKRGFDDDAWDVKPSKQAAQPPRAPSQTSTAPSAPATTASAPVKPTPTGAMADLTLLSKPLEPVVTHSTGAQPPHSQQSMPLPQPIQPQQTLQSQSPAQYPMQQGQYQQQSTQQMQNQQQGASPAFFGQLAPQMTGLPQQGNATQYQGVQQTGQGQYNPPRQRPQAPQITQQGPIMPPPPARPLSAPQNASGQSGFGPPPLQPQLTGVGNQQNFQNQSGSSPQSLNELNQLRLQQQQQQQQQQMGQQQQQMQPQMTGFGQQPPYSTGFQSPFTNQQTGMGQFSQMRPQMTGVPQQQMPFIIGQQTGSPFADPQMQMQRTGMQPNMTGMPQHGGSINSMLPPALQPQATGMQPQSTGMQPQPTGLQQQSTGFSGLNGLNNRPGFGQPPPPMPSLPPQYSQSVSPPPMPQQQQQAPAPLQPQKTGPAPPVRFGVGNDAKKLMPQSTGRRANLSQATADNPFGF